MVSGGGEIATTRVRAELKYPTGKAEKVNISGDLKKWSMFWVCINGYQKTFTNGDLLITFFDSDNNQIGQSTIKMADYSIIDRRAELSQNLYFGILKSGTKQAEIMKYIVMISDGYDM